MALEVYDGHEITQLGLLRLHHRADLDPQVLLKAIQTPGDLLKRSSKTETRRVGEWLVKRSLPERGLGPVKRTLARNRYRRAWRAANWLRAHGVHVPEPLAYGEWTAFGAVFGNVMVTEFLDGFENVELYAARLAKEAQELPFIPNWPPHHDYWPPPPAPPLDSFFHRLAEAINGLEEAGAYHADLSGKNIFTKDGQEFYFIDLDGVVLGIDHRDKHRLKNHVQLYDSFCDFCDTRALLWFHAHVQRTHVPLESWMQAVVEGQAARRRRHQE